MKHDSAKGPLYNTRRRVRAVFHRLIIAERGLDGIVKSDHHRLTCQCGSKTASTDSQPAVGFWGPPAAPQPWTGLMLKSQLQAATVDMGAPDAPDSLETCGHI